MDDDTLIHPLDVLSTYATAGAFVEPRLSRLKATPNPDAEDVQAAEGLSQVLFAGIVMAISELEDSVTVVPVDVPERMLS